MRLTELQREAVEEQGHLYLRACPGSGKTRVAVAKLLKVLEDIAGTPRRVACLTYTNAAVYEIERRLAALGGGLPEEQVEIATLHSFCLHNILRHYHWMTVEYREGFEVADPDSDVYRDTLASVRASHGLTRWQLDAFAFLSRAVDGSPVSEDIPPEAALEFWSLLADQGVIDFPSIVFYSFQLLRDNPTIARGLAARFAWILIDEAQDTSSLQVRILELIRDAAHGGETIFFMVGDPAQSIYGFAGARPDMMDAFAESLGARIDIELTENFRSSNPIIRHADRLQPRNRPMTATGDAAVYSDEPRYVHSDSSFDAITQDFLPWLQEVDIPIGKAAVFAPWWVRLYNLGRALRELGVPIMGPGARPYGRRRHLIAPIAEQVGAYIARPEPDRLRAVERALFLLIIEMTGRADYRVYTYRGRRSVVRLLRRAAASRSAHPLALPWLTELATAMASIMSEDDLLPRSVEINLVESVAGMSWNMLATGADPATLTVEQLGVFGDPRDSLHLLTLHGSKGREFEAVAVIDLHEGVIPHQRTAGDPEQIAEARRLLYVAITRPRRVLLYSTDQSDYRNRPSRFLREVLD